jgi:metal-dependent hydrolase (beta-lactamase superfamily II)
VKLKKEIAGNVIANIISTMSTFASLGSNKLGHSMKKKSHATLIRPNVTSDETSLVQNHGFVLIIACSPFGINNVVLAVCWLNKCPDLIVFEVMTIYVHSIHPTLVSMHLYFHLIEF